MQNPLDIMIDCSNKLTEDWCEYRAIGKSASIKNIYHSAIEIYQPSRPATIQEYLDFCENQKSEVLKIFFLEALSCDLSTLVKENK